MLCDERIRKIAPTMNNTACEIAYYGWRLRKAARWVEFGCQTESEYVALRKIPYSTWRRYVLVGRVLEALPFESLAEIGIRRAMLLAKVHPDVWPDYNWLKEAKQLHWAEFERLVQSRNGTVPSDGAADERRRSRRVSKAKLRAIKDEHGLGNIDQALQLVLADSSQSKDVHANLFAAAKHTRKLLTLAAGALRCRQSHQSKEAHRLILKARQRISEAVNLVVARATSEEATNASST